MANKYKYIRDIRNKLSQIVLHERADGYFEEVVRVHQEWGEGNALTRAHVTSADASSGVDLTAAPAAGKKISLVSLRIVAGATLTVDITEETSGTVILRTYVVAGSDHVYTPVVPIQLPTAVKKARITASGAGDVTVEAFYFTS